MSTNQIEAWATPVGGLQNVADHTFVVCDNIHFGCWGTSHVKHPDGKLIMTGTGENLLRIVKQYGGIFDTGNLGTYLINGVCHQSTNLFLFATNKWCMPLGYSRPKGLIASYLFYSLFGTNFKNWLINYYVPACLYVKLNDEEGVEMLNMDAQLLSDIILNDLPKESLVYKVYQNHMESSDDSVDSVVKDMSVLLKHTLNLDKHPILKTHTEVIQEKNRILAKYELTNNLFDINKTSFSKDDILTICNELNQLSIELQSELKQEIKLDSYIQCFGDDAFYSPINPDIAVNMLMRRK